MALIKCSECGKELSDQANACPACGGPSPKAKEDEIAEMGCAGCALIIGVALMLVPISLLVRWLPEAHEDAIRSANRKCDTCVKIFRATGFGRQSCNDSCQKANRLEQISPIEYLFSPW